MTDTELAGFSSIPLHVKSFEESLRHATIVTNPATGQSYRINDIDDDTQQALCVDEDTGEHLTLATADLEGWTIYTLQKVVHSTLGSDKGLTAAQLEAKYSPRAYGEHPTYARDAWRDSISCGATLAGYWEWVAYGISLE